ncbi:MAG: hypothetical protein HYR60_12485 [Acidobacteria bacterium]|nr:hypothetical protein [Acidobacteriota bacterium]
MAGRRFYSPDVIAAYCVFSLPLGLFLHGLNVTRSGSRMMGYALTSTPAAAFLAPLAAGSLGAKAHQLFIYSTYLGVFVGIGLLNSEGRPYRLALSRGAVAARWWPPLLWALGAMVLAMVIAAVFGPEVIVE